MEIAARSLRDCEFSLPKAILACSLISSLARLATLALALAPAPARPCFLCRRPRAECAVELPNLIACCASALSFLPLLFLLNSPPLPLPPRLVHSASPTKTLKGSSRQPTPPSSKQRPYGKSRANERTSERSDDETTIDWHLRSKAQAHKPSAHTHAHTPPLNPTLNRPKREPPSAATQHEQAHARRRRPPPPLPRKFELCGVAPVPAPLPSAPRRTIASTLLCSPSSSSRASLPPPTPLPHHRRFSPSPSYSSLPRLAIMVTIMMVASSFVAAMSAG